MTTVREQLLARADDSRPGLLAEDRAWSWAEVVAESDRYGAALASLLDPALPPHVAVLLDNVPEFLFTLGGAALHGQVVVGLNSTRRGAALASDLARTDCQLVLTEPHLRDLLPADLDVPVIDVTESSWLDRVAAATPADTQMDVDDDTLLMLIFTSGTSGDPKAVRITHQKVSGPGATLGERFGLSAGPTQDVAYLSMPLFHSNAVMAGWAPALATGTAVALGRRFSASGFLPDIRRYGATYANYVGKPLTYVLSTPELPDDADNPLRLAFGNEANEADIATFARRFGCEVIDSYSSSENAIIVQRRAEMPRGALGVPLAGIKVLDPETHDETVDAVFDDTGRLLNPEQAIGELVNTTGAGAFAGYYKDVAAENERMRGGMYWSGDLAYRDADGWIYFAGRSGDWLRVDGENLAAAPIERILLRHPAIAEAAVFAVPDEKVGDQVACAIILRGALGTDDLAVFLAEQADLSPKAWPQFVQVVDDLPRTATNKVLKRQLQAAWSTDATTTRQWWVREPRGRRYAAQPS